MTFYENLKKENPAIPYIPREVYERILEPKPLCEHYIEVVAVPDLKTLQNILQNLEEDFTDYPPNVDFSKNIEYLHLYEKVYNYVVYEENSGRIYTTLYIQF